MMPIITPNWMSFLLQVRMAGKNKISMMTLDKRKRVLKMPKGVIVVSASLAAINPPPQMAATRRSVKSAASIAVLDERNRVIVFHLRHRYLRNL